MVAAARDLLAPPQALMRVRRQIPRRKGLMWPKTVAARLAYSRWPTLDVP
jgi:hypothetical protein